LFGNLVAFCTFHWVPRGGGGGPWAVGYVGIRGLYGDFATNFCPCGGEMWGLRILNALLSGRMCLDFASVQLRGDWERSIVCSCGEVLPNHKHFSLIGANLQQRTNGQG